jgi:hypothetical protein
VNVHNLEITLKSSNIYALVEPGNHIVGVVTSAVYIILFELASVAAHLYEKTLGTAWLFQNQNMQLLIHHGILIYFILSYLSFNAGSSKQKYLGFKILS